MFENYEESFRKLNELFEINPRYLPAEQLYKDVKEILNKTNK